MRNQVAASLARGDMKGMAEALRKVASLAPPEFTTWSQLANDGARAAELGDRRAVRATCNGCHQAWREPYRERFRERPLRAGQRRLRAGEVPPAMASIGSSAYQTPAGSRTSVNSATERTWQR